MFLEFNNYCDPGWTIPRAWPSKWTFQGFKRIFLTFNRWRVKSLTLKMDIPRIQITDSTSSEPFEAWPSRWISQEFRYICNIRLIAISIRNVITQNGWFLTLTIAGAQKGFSKHITSRRVSKAQYERDATLEKRIYYMCNLQIEYKFKLTKKNSVIYPSAFITFRTP